MVGGVVDCLTLNCLFHTKWTILTPAPIACFSAKVVFSNFCQIWQSKRICQRLCPWYFLPWRRIWNEGNRAVYFLMMFKKFICSINVRRCSFPLLPHSLLSVWRRVFRNPRAVWEAPAKWVHVKPQEKCDQTLFSLREDVETLKTVWDFLSHSKEGGETELWTAAEADFSPICEQMQLKILCLSNLESFPGLCVCLHVPQTYLGFQ